MSVHVKCFEWEKGKNDLEYIKLLEDTIERDKNITNKALKKIRDLDKENKQLREEKKKIIDKLEDYSFNAHTSSGMAIDTEVAIKIIKREI